MGKEICGLYKQEFFVYSYTVFCLGNSIYKNEEIIKAKTDSRCLLILMICLTLISCMEHIIISDIMTNGDIYITTPFLAAAVFIYFLYCFKAQNKCLKIISEMGAKYSMLIYVFHVMIRKAEFIIVYDIGKIKRKKITKTCKHETG